MRACVLKFFSVSVIVASVALGMLDNADTLVTGTQTSPGQGIIYLTRAQAAPDGAIVKLQDLQLGLLQPIVGGLSYPNTVLCGSDGRLYVDEVLGVNHGHGRIQRFNQVG
jgi:hypothetical protein